MRTRRSPRNQDRLFKALGRETRADFALRSAAPQLLEACKLAQLHLSDLHQMFYRGCDAKCVTHLAGACRNLLRQQTHGVIAKLSAAIFSAEPERRRMPKAMKKPE
jgi:hypothetical protein